MKLTENAESLLKDFYCRENESTWDEVCRRVARAVASSEELAAYWEEEFYSIINNLCFLPSSPCFLNADVNNPGQLSSCFIISLQDNIESIYKAKQECAKIFQKNGGVGFNISVLRPRNAPVETSKGTSCGVVGFMEEFNLTADIVTRGNKRKGAMKIDLNDWHPDLLEFIKCKDDPTNFEFMNISVSLSDDFMIAVEEDLVWTFLFPDYHKMKTIYDEEWDGDLDSWIDKGYPVKSYGEMPAREIYNIIMKQAHKNGEPGVSFRDTMNKANPNPTYGSVNSTNPCFTGKMKLLTNEGYKTFEELCDTEPLIINANNEISQSKIWCSGEKEVIKLTFTDYSTIECTPNHIFQSIDNQEIKAQDLKETKVRVKQYYGKPASHDTKFVQYGFLQGDGDLGRLKSNAHKSLEVNIGKKDGQEIANLFALTYEEGKTSYYLKHLPNLKNDLIKLGFDDKKLYERTFPNTYNNWEQSEKLAFLCGCYSANGCVIKNHRVAYKTTSVKFANQLIEALKEFGMNPTITTNKPKKVQFNNGEYECKESYDVNLNKFKDCITFYNLINFIHSYKREALYELLLIKSPKVKSITKIGVKKVYDFTEPLTHWGIVNDYIVHNCAEFASIPYNSCNLGSINLSKFVTDNEFEWDNFTAVVQKAMRFLDDMITVNKLPFDKLDYITKNLRSVGMGVMGLADCLYQLKIPYGSNAALLFVDRLLKVMYDECISTSNGLAEEKGTYPWYEWSIYDEMNFKVRNSNFLSIAPNGTISIIANTSGGIEPQFGLVYKRRTHEDKIYYFVNPYFEEALIKRGIKLDESRKQEIYNNHGSCQNLKWVPADLQEVFVIASDLTPLEHLNIATTAQKIVDLSISKTINLPNDCTVEDIADVYLKAWQDGLKGVTVYRDGSRPDQVLSTAKTKNEKNAEVLDKREGKTRKDFGERLSGATYQKHVACGKLYITINKDQEGNPVEIFVTTGKSGGCTANAEESGRLASLALRHGVPVEQVIKTIKGIRCGACLNAKGSKIKQIDGYSCGDVLAKTLMQELTNKTQDIAAATACPECGSTELLSYEGGCKVCHNCGWSKCG